MSWSRFEQSAPEVREATPDDAFAISRVDLAAHRRAYRHIFGDTYLQDTTRAANVQRWERLLQRQSLGREGPPLLILVAVNLGQVVAYAGLMPARDSDAMPKTAEVGMLYVHPDHWRRGIGATLLAAAVERLRREGYEEVTLWALEENHDARAFYEAQGWHLDGTERTGDHGHVEVRYRLLLQP